jgi:Xaa-Pro aminopeptidase
MPEYIPMRMPTARQIARLTFAPTSRSADARYIAGMEVSDAFVAMMVVGKRIAVASSLELGNFKKYSACDRVLSLEELQRSLKAELRGRARWAGVIAAAVAAAGATQVEVGEDFPAGIYHELSQLLPCQIVSGALFPERDAKDAVALKEIKAANRTLAEGFALVANALAQAKVVKGKLMRAGKPLTSEDLRGELQELFIRRGLVPVSDLIVAGGRQACDPHCLGRGVLRAGELIVVDLFAPRVGSHYWGDMTRTYLRGQPTDAQVALVETVANAQRWAIEAIAPGIKGAQIHEGVKAIFEKNGYQTEERAEGYVGFFHGTGHSLGLEVHDNGAYAPSLSGRGRELALGEVLTVEPGLYYPEIGGCRIEDNVVVCQDGCEKLSRSPYKWVLP